MKEFKPGQRVKIKDYHYVENHCYNNATGTVLYCELRFGSLCYKIKLDEKFHKRVKERGYTICPIIQDLYLVPTGNMILANE